MKRLFTHISSIESRQWLRWFGNGLIFASLIGFGVIFYPVAMEYLWPHQRVQHQVSAQDDFGIVIPKLSLQARVIAEVDPWDQSEYLDALENGVAHAAGTMLPEEQGTVYLFSHSSDVPWRLTRYNTAFLRLHELKPGDIVELWRFGEVHRYQVREIASVWPNETEYLTETDRDQLVLQTCTPIGTDLKRLLVFADPME